MTRAILQFCEYWLNKIRTVIYVNLSWSKLGEKFYAQNIED